MSLRIFTPPVVVISIAAFILYALALCFITGCHHEVRQHRDCRDDVIIVHEMADPDMVKPEQDQ